MCRVSPAVAGAPEMGSIVAAVRGEQDANTRLRAKPTATAALQLLAHLMVTPSGWAAGVARVRLGSGPGCRLGPRRGACPIVLGEHKLADANRHRGDLDALI